MIIKPFVGLVLFGMSLQSAHAIKEPTDLGNFTVALFGHHPSMCHTLHLPIIGMAKCTTSMRPLILALSSFNVRHSLVQTL